MIKLKASDVDTSYEALNNPQKDIFNRKKEIENLSRIIENTSEPLVLSIDSAWGTGKTTFIKYWKSYLDNTDNNINAIHFNAWESDYTEDPLIALVATIDEWCQEKNNIGKTQKSWKKAKELLPILAKKSAVIGVKAVTLGSIDAEKEYENLAAQLSGETADQLITTFNAKNKASDDFKEFIKEITSNKTKIVIFIDELDRCRPTYAIETLERIKHLFNIENVTFILATDLEQLSHSICAVYGNEFNGKEYLNRFIDIKYSIKEPNPGLYLDHIFKNTFINNIFENRKSKDNERNQLLNCIRILSSRFKLTLRELDNTSKKLNLILKTIPENNYIDTPLIATLIFLKERNLYLYNNFIADTTLAKEVITFISTGLSKEDLYSNYFSSMKGFLLNQAKTTLKGKDFFKYLEEYDKIANLECKEEIDYIKSESAKITSLYAKNPRKNLNSSTVDLQKIINRIELYENLSV